MSVLEVLLLVLLSVQAHATAAMFDRLDAALVDTFTFSVMVAEPPASSGVLSWRQGLRGIRATTPPGNHHQGVLDGPDGGDTSGF